jgi:hypothetical protein
MHGENLRKFMETRARAPRARYELILPRPIIQYDGCTNVQNGRQNGRNVSGITKNGAGYPVLLGARVREYLGTHPSPHGISSAAGTDPNCFGCEFIKKCDFVPSVCYAPARGGAAVLAASTNFKSLTYRASRHLERAIIVFFFFFQK